MTDLRHIDVWVFDLDNTLYSAECRLFEQIDAKMTDFIRKALNVTQEQARFLQKDFYVRHGTTMRGLMLEHKVEPGDFLDYVHDIDVSVIAEDADLGRAIDALPGRKYIYTNGSTRHAENVAGALGVIDAFDGVFDIQAADYVPKPNRAPYEQFVRAFDIAPERAAMFEDLVQNLEPPHAMGMTTVLVCSDAEWLSDEPAAKRPARRGDTADHVHHATDHLAGFLAQCLKRAA